MPGSLPQISDNEMNGLLGTSKPYTAVLLRLTDKGRAPDAQPIIWEHGRRNIALRAVGKMPVICPATDDSDWAGMGIFAAEPEEVDRILTDDPGVKAGVFTYELHPVFSFPGSALE